MNMIQLGAIVFGAVFAQRMLKDIKLTLKKGLLVGFLGFVSIGVILGALIAWVAGLV